MEPVVYRILGCNWRPVVPGVLDPYNAFLVFQRHVLISECGSWKDLILLSLTLHHVWLIRRVSPCQIL
jgi:hypothetical protein